MGVTEEGASMKDKIKKAILPDRKGDGPFYFVEVAQWICFI